MFGCFWHHDPAANSRDGAVAWGNNWVTLGINVNLAFLTRPVCLLVLFRLDQQRRPGISKLPPDPERPAKPQLAQDMLRLLAKRFPDREIHLVADAAYTNRALRRLPENVTFTGRLRANAALHALPERRPGRGRPARKGHKLPQLAHIATDPATRWQPTTVRRYGKTEHVLICSFQCLWYEVSGAQPVQVLIIKHPTPNRSGVELALISLHRPSRQRRDPDRTLRRPLAHRSRLRTRQRTLRRRPPPQPHPNRGPPHHPLPVPHDDPHDHLVRTTRTPPRRRPSPPPPRSLVLRQDHPIVRRHARQAPPRDHRQPISPGYGSDPKTRRNHPSPTRMGAAAGLGTRENPSS